MFALFGTCLLPWFLLSLGSLTLQLCRFSDDPDDFRKAFVDTNAAGVCVTTEEVGTVEDEVLNGHAGTDTSLKVDEAANDCEVERGCCLDESAAAEGMGCTGLGRTIK